MEDTAKALDRVRKLLALSKSSNEHEAAQAAALAQRIMEEHRLSMAMLDASGAGDAPMVWDDPLDSGGRMGTWRIRLALAVANTNGCEIISIRGGGVTLRVVGRASDATTVRYLYAFCVRAIDGLAKQYAGRGAPWLNNYRAGCVDTIGARLERERASQRSRMRDETPDRDAFDRAIVRVDDRLAESQQALADRFPNSRSRPMSEAGRIVPGARERGQRDGHSIDFARGGAGLGAPARQIAGRERAVRRTGHPRGCLVVGSRAGEDAVSVIVEPSEHGTPLGSYDVQWYVRRGDTFVLLTGEDRDVLCAYVTWSAEHLKPYEAIVATCRSQPGGLHAFGCEATRDAFKAWMHAGEKEMPR